ncbi:ligase-associated DNA damage response endonuclease PdeM [Aquibaculum arenosum]|uniref:Ligase-associated DNA damage response endonuclease PdeM n=1 Tax=Aquibaculum arenosum TaxID=3032591 RepID=A0ABT5YI54_9PROT|nr:ligase-associated DNA damage response endonuclease PdeM [Fodinicurvata sp. CAU 1616]MDF2094621.1 ligase-associated DNA damage response endonuclease PdeM [Fodinicurvata sp. CAU 1616]
MSAGAARTISHPPPAPSLLLNGVDLTPEPEGAVWWAEKQTLLLADLHLEKGSAYARRGSFLPPYDSAATLTRLEELLRRRPARRVVCLGDSFHDGEAADRLPREETDRLRALAAERDWIWLAGNHDPAPPGDSLGRVMEELVLGPLVLRHEAHSGLVAGEVSGHYHPKASVSHRLGRFTGRCFVHDGRRLILPAFGAYAGGLDVLAPAIARLFPRGFAVHLPVRGHVHAFPHSVLRQVR